MSKHARWRFGGWLWAFHLNIQDLKLDPSCQVLQLQQPYLVRNSRRLMVFMESDLTKPSISTSHRRVSLGWQWCKGSSLQFKCAMCQCFTFEIEKTSPNLTTAHSDSGSIPLPWHDPSSSPALPFIHLTTQTTQTTIKWRPPTKKTSSQGMIWPTNAFSWSSHTDCPNKNNQMTPSTWLFSWFDFCSQFPFSILSQAWIFIHFLRWSEINSSNPPT